MDAFVIDDRGDTKTLVTKGNWCLRFSGKDIEECGYSKDDTVWVIADDKSIKLYNWTNNGDHRSPCQAILGCKDTKILPPPVNRSDITAEDYIIPPGGLRYLPLIKNNDAFKHVPIPIGKLSTEDYGEGNACKIYIPEIQLHYE